MFPGRELVWKDWKPVVLSETAGGEAVEYSGHIMSDGEKSALFLAARTLSADPGVLIVDEPETHLHSLLAARLGTNWRDARRDIRFVYVTHDLTFALSRRDATYVLSSPTDGLKRIELQEDRPGGLVVGREAVDNIEPGAVTIFPDEAKLRYDIVIPQLTRALARSDSPLNQLHPADIPDPKKQLAVPDVQPDEYV